MDLDTLMVATSCLIDDALPAAVAGPIRRRGPVPKLTDAEVLTLEGVGALLGLEHDTAIYAFFQQHSRTWFPTLDAIHRTTFARQAAHRWIGKERLWQAMADRVPHDPHVALIDRCPVPVCRFARAKRCRLFGGVAAFGYDEAARQTFFGFRGHVRLAWPGVCLLAPYRWTAVPPIPLAAASCVRFATGSRPSSANASAGSTRGKSGRGIHGI